MTNHLADSDIRQILETMAQHAHTLTSQAALELRQQGNQQLAFWAAASLFVPASLSMADANLSQTASGLKRGAGREALRSPLSDHVEHGTPVSQASRDSWGSPEGECLSELPGRFQHVGCQNQT